MVAYYVGFKHVKNMTNLNATSLLGCIRCIYFIFTTIREDMENAFNFNFSYISSSKHMFGIKN